MSIFRKITAALVAALFASQALLAVHADALYITDRQYEKKFDLLTRELRKDEDTLDAIEKLGFASVFVSVSDGRQKAKVFNYSASDLDSALDKTFSKAKTSGMTPKWVKLDVVTSSQKTTYKQFTSERKDTNKGSFRKGIAFNQYIGTALLESQINSSGLLNYDTGRLDLKRVNAELSRMSKKQLTKIPSDIWIIKTQGYFAEKSYAMKLTNGSNGSTGRREVTISRETIEAMAQKSSGYLASIDGDNGKFVYGYYPIDNSEIEGYNILRHAGTVWNLIMQYEMCGDNDLIPHIENGLELLRNNIHYKDPVTAFVIDGNNLNVGANGLALLAYSTYAEVFGSPKFNSLINALANGVLFMQKANGRLVHEISMTDYKVTKKYIIIYYDGEAIYGLLKAYGVLGNKKFLQAAQKSCDYFIAKHYENENSHWISYTFNELTKYVPEEKYFEFGLKNITTNNHLASLTRSKVARHAANETVNAAFELYDRLITGGYKCDYLREFDAKALMACLEKRINHGLEYFMFPEYAMYFNKPQTVLYSFAVREDDFRIRIDDVQHFMDGYYMYWKNFDRIQYYIENPYEPEPEPEAEPEPEPESEPVQEPAEEPPQETAPAAEAA